MSGQAPIFQALQDAGEQEPNPILQWAAQKGRADSEAATGWEWAGYQGLNLAKTVGDASAHLGSLAWRAARAAGSTVTDFDPSVGWEAGAKDVERFTGTRDAGIIDYLQAASGSIGGWDGPQHYGGLTLGQATDKVIAERLGKSALISSAAGTLLGFATGPGALVGKTGAAMVGPVANVAERIAAKSVSKGVLSAEQATKLVTDGKFWAWYAKEAPKGGGMLRALTALGGRNARDLLGTTAGNIAQSYALAPESEAMAGAQSALLMSPFLVPVARMGSAMSRVLTSKLSDTAKTQALSIYEDLAAGKITPRQANTAFKQALPSSWRAMNAAMVSAFEGTAFTALDPHGREVWSKALSGDKDAWEELGLMTLGTTAGLAAVKYGMPADLAPMFKHVRPELNSLKIHMEAEASKRAAEQAKQTEIKQQELDALRAADDVELTDAQKAKIEFQEMFTDIYNREYRAIEKQYGRAAVTADPMVKVGWQPSFHAEVDGVVLSFGDAKIAVDQNESGVRVGLDEAAQRALKDAGLDVPADLSGEQAQGALDKLALLSLRAQTNAISNYTRLGLEETSDGRWLDGTEGIVFTPNLDGSSELTDLFSGESRGTEHVVTVNGFGPDVFEHPTMDAFAEAVAAKQALAPDPVIDPIIVGAINEARFGTGTGAETLREFFSVVPPEALIGKLKMGEDQGLAWQLGAAVTGHGNAKSLLDAFVKAPEPTPETQGPTGEMEAFGGIPLKGLVEGAQRQGMPLYDFFFESAPDVIAAHGGEELGRKFKEASSEAQTIRGKAQAQVETWERAGKKSKTALREEVEVEGQPFAKSRWIALVQDEVAPRNAQEREFQAGAKATLKALWDEGVSAGVMNVRPNAQGKPEYQPITPRENVVVPREYHRDYFEKILPDNQKRQAFFDLLAQNNKLTIKDSQTGRMRPMTGADLEARYLEAGSDATNASPAEKQAALEFVREMQHVPMRFQGDQVLEPNVFEAMRRIVQRQSGRVGTVKVFGQDLPEAVRQKYGINKIGLSAELERFNRTKPGKDVENLARDTAELVQGKTLTEDPGYTKIARILTGGPLEGLVRSAITAGSWVHDVFPAHFAATTGGRRFIKALGEVANDPKEAGRYSERLGTLAKDLGITDAVEAEGWTSKLGDAIGWLATRSERLKTAVATKSADGMLADWSRGKRTANDIGVVRDLLRVSQQETMALVTGKASPELQNRFRHEMVQLLTDRTPAALASRFAQSPNIMRLVRFSRWATGRMRNVARSIVSVQRAMKHGTPAEQRAAVRRLFATGALMTVGGVAGQALSYLWVDLFRDPTNPLGGAKRWWQDMTFAPMTMLWRAGRNQLIGGPFAQMVNAVQNAEDASGWANLTAPTAMAFATAKTFSKPLDASTPLDFFANLGVVPKELKNSAIAATMLWAGEDPEAASNHRLAYQFDKLEGIKQTVGQRNKPEAFYEAMADVRSALARHPDDRKAALEDAMEGIRKALELAPEESVAATIDSYRLTRDYNNEQRVRFAEYVGDDARMQRIYAQDEALREIAKHVRQMEGTHPTPLDQELESVTQQAALGASDRWRPLAERVVDEAATAMIAGGLPGDDLQEVAAAMSHFPEQLASALSEKQMRLVNSKNLSAGSRSRLIAQILRARVLDRYRREKKERRE